MSAYDIWYEKVKVKIQKLSVDGLIQPDSPVCYFDTELGMASDHEKKIYHLFMTERKLCNNSANVEADLLFDLFDSSVRLRIKDIPHDSRITMCTNWTLCYYREPDIQAMNVIYAYNRHSIIN